MANADPMLLQWIQAHKVCWELSPYYVANNHVKIQVGYELDLYAQIDPHLKVNPGCKQCESIFEKLKAIGESVLPTDLRPTRYDVQQFDASFHLRPETKLKPEIQLKILIVHREGFFNPVDECELRCSNDTSARHAVSGFAAVFAP